MSFSTPLDFTTTSAQSVKAAVAGTQVHVRGFLLTPAAAVEVRFRNITGGAILGTFLLQAGASVDISADDLMVTALGSGLEVVTITNVRLTGIVWGYQQ